MKWTEGLVHVTMRQVLCNHGWILIAGEYPGGSDHDLYPLNVSDPAVARDQSPDPRRHSLGELIPDIVAIRNRDLLIGEAKTHYDEGDRNKLDRLVTTRKPDLLSALRKFSVERGFPQLLPVETLVLRPTLIFIAPSTVPAPAREFSYLRIIAQNRAIFEGALDDERRC